MARDTLEQLLQLGFEHFNGGRFAQAEGVYRKILDREPRNHEAIHMTAVIAHATGHVDRAGKLFARAIELAPEAGHYYHNAGKFFAENDKHASAIPYLKKAAELISGDARVYANLAQSYRSVGRLDEAEGAAREGLAIAGDDAGCLAQLGNVLREMGRIPEGVEALKRSVAKKQIAAIHDNLIFLLYNDPATGAGEFREHHRVYSSLYTDPLMAYAKGHAGVEKSAERKLRVGYVSADFRLHPVMAFMDAPLRAHDPKQFEITCYAVNVKEDETTRRVKGYGLKYVDARYDGFEEFVRRIRRDRIDILVDLNGHTAHNRMLIFAAKPAPIQISYLGDPGTTGMGQMDYRISDAIVDPIGETEGRYTEELLRLPGGFSCYTPDGTRNPDVSRLPAMEKGYVTFGSLHALAKINEGVIDLWARLLRAVPGARLMVLRHTLTGSTLERYREAFVSRGVEAGRLDLRHQAHGPTHLHSYREIDCCLDTFPFSGHTTTCEGLYNGVPTLTLAEGDGPPHSRLVASVLRMGGLGEFVAGSKEEFVTRGVEIAGDLGRLAELCAGLRGQILGSALCDAGGFTRELEAAYRGVWRRYCEGM